MKKHHICVFHKCGSNWFRNIILSLADALQFSYLPQTTNPGKLNEAVDRQADQAFMIYNSNTRKGVLAHLEGDEKVVLCVRDPRDALVSQYWSWRESHANNTPRILAMREEFKSLSERDGMSRLLEQRYFPFGEDMLKWDAAAIGEPRVKVLRYESLKADFAGEVSAMLSFLGIDPLKVDIAAVESVTSFERKTKRAPGAEDRSAHLRKGIVGDHVNYFDSGLSQQFDAAYGEVMRRLAYTA